jgi:glycerol-3-phosphate dehydrogenase (NAD(P)+)
MAVSVAVIGAGAWGSVVAQMFADNGHNVKLWCYKQAIADAITHTHQHHRLPNIELNTNIQTTTELSDCYHSDLVVLGLSSAQLCDYDTIIDWQEISCPILVLAKGVMVPEIFISNWVAQRVQVPVGVLSGPNLALEIAQCNPAASVVAFTDNIVAKQVQTWLSTPYFRCYTSTDLIGVQCGGIFKNVLAIAAGCIDGMALGDNAKASLVTRGLVELQRIAHFYGGQAETVVGLSGLGDLMATCVSSKSRNWQLGHAMVTQSNREAWFLEDRGETEGVRTIQLVYDTFVEQSLDLPIIMAVGRLFKEQVAPQDMIKELMERGLKSEFPNQ